MTTQPYVTGMTRAKTKQTTHSSLITNIDMNRSLNYTDWCHSGRTLNDFNVVIIDGLADPQLKRDVCLLEARQ